MTRKSILEVLSRREYDGRSHERKTARTLFESPLRKHNLCWTREKIAKGVTYDGNLYVAGYKEWFPGCFQDNVPHFLYSGLSDIESSSRKRVKGTLRYQSSRTRLNDCFGLENGYYAECLFALTGPSLFHYILCEDRWAMKTSIFLSDGYCFTHIDYDIDGERFFLKSKQYPTATDEDILCYFAIFEMAPLKFVGLLALRKSLFGQFKDAYIRNGLLALLSNKTFYFYDLEDILKRFLMKTYYIDQRLGGDERKSGGSESRVGAFPLGLPQNILITDRPMLLFKFSCAQKIRDFSFGGYPWTCLVNYPQNNDYSIHRLFDHRKIVVYHERSTSIDDKFTFYHFDNSGRILNMENDHIKCLKVDPNFHNDSVTTLFNISFARENAPTSQTTTRSGRTIRSAKYAGAAELDPPIVHALDYSEDLDVIAVLYTDTVDVSPTFVVGFYDNRNGAFVREFPLCERVSDKDDFAWDLYLNEFVVICVQKPMPPKSNQKCFIYSLVNKLT